MSTDFRQHGATVTLGRIDAPRWRSRHLSATSRAGSWAQVRRPKARSRRTGPVTDLPIDTDVRSGRLRSVRCKRQPDEWAAFGTDGGWGGVEFVLGGRSPRIIMTCGEQADGRVYQYPRHSRFCGEGS